MEREKLAQTPINPSKKITPGKLADKASSGNPSTVKGLSTGAPELSVGDAAQAYMSMGTSATSKNLVEASCQINEKSVPVVSRDVEFIPTPELEEMLGYLDKGRFPNSINTPVGQSEKGPCFSGFGQDAQPKIAMCKQMIKKELEDREIMEGQTGNV